MAKTPETLITDALLRLGDSDEIIWTRPELFRYTKEGYDRIAVGTECIWDTTYLEDVETTANLTSAVDIPFLSSGDSYYGIFTYTSPVDVDYLEAGNLNLGPTNHTFNGEASYLTENYMQAVHDLPDPLIELERSTWNMVRIEPLNAVQLERADSFYQYQTGQVMGYLREKDGLNKLRKWRIPSAVSDQYTYTGTWGTPRTITDISTETVHGSWGIPRMVPDQEVCFGSYPRGVARRFFKTSHNTKIEFSRKGRTLLNESTEIELPDRYAKYIRHFVMYRALERNGPGQDLNLSAFWKGLFDAGIARIKKRKSSIQKRKTYTLGGEGRTDQRPPVARMPWNYGVVIR